MATNLETLETARTSLISKIAEFEANPLPDTALDGQSYAYNTQLNSMYDRLQKLNTLIQQVGGPVLIRSRGRAV